MHGRHACRILGVMAEGKKAMAQDMIHHEALLNVVV
jgi:hypothetical protein